jgi:hypothetical protein
MRRTKLEYWPIRDQDLRLTWNRFLCDILPRLRAECRRLYPAADLDLLEKSIADGFLALESGEQFDCLRGGPFDFLRAKIKGWVANGLRAQRRRRRRESLVDWSDKKIEKNLLPHVVKSPRPDNYYIEGLDCPNPSELLDHLFAGLSSFERAEAQYLADRRPIDDWIHLLGLDDKPSPERPTLVYREKDRLRKKLRRIRRKMWQVQERGG